MGSANIAHRHSTVLPVYREWDGMGRRAKYAGSFKPGRHGGQALVAKMRRDIANIQFKQSNAILANHSQAIPHADTST